jgi:hypothetical protein
MSNEQLDWEAGLEHESKAELIRLVKHFQEMAFDNHDHEASFERYLLGRAVNAFTDAAEHVKNGGRIETKDGDSPNSPVNVSLVDFILGWGSKYTLDNITFVNAREMIDGEEVQDD